MMDQTERINIKIPGNIKNALRKIASLEGESMSVIIRRLIRKEATKLGVWQICRDQRENRGNFES